MANEATIRVGLAIRKVSGSLILIDKNYSAGYPATVTGRKGPSPGAITATPEGVDVDFSNLTTPGLAWLTNLSATIPVDYGIWEPDTSKFYPVHRLNPGEKFPCRFSPDLGEQYAGTGTGTDSANNRLRFRGIGGSADVTVEAFEV